MKTTKLFNSILLPAFVAVFLLAGCEPENFNFSKKVSFTAATKYENPTTATKTAYSGEEFEFNSLYWERIDWVNGDMIRIFSNVARTPSDESSADYKVTGVTTRDNDKNSYATVTTVGSSGLEWGSGEHIFFGMYPSPATSDVPSATNFTMAADGLTATISGTIPTVQSVSKGTSTSPRDTVYQPDMRYAYMSAATTASSGGEVNLEFKPLFNAFEFTIGNSAAESMVLKSAELVTVPERHRTAVTGTFSAKIGRTNNVSLDDGFPAYEAGVNDRVTVNFGSGVDISRGHCVSFTMLALPMTYRAMRVILKGTSGGTDFTKSLDLKYSDGQYCEFSFARKYHIRIGAPSPEEPWIYVIEPEPISTITTYGHVAMTAPDFTVKSYKYKASDPTNKVAVPWQLEFSANGTSGWSTTPDARLSLTSTSGVGGATGETVTPSIARTHYDSEKETTGHDSEASAIAELRNRTEVGSSSSPFDLSTHPFYGNINSTISRETANCYVITRAGHYRIPLVYGNAIKNGTTNENAYKPNGDGAGDANDNDHFMRRFLRHDDNYIVDPWISGNGITVANAVVVWQDVDGAANQILLDSDLSINGNYLDFEIKKDNIRPGNIVVAARNASNVIVWSWHLWVTEKDLSPVSITDRNSVTHQMLPYNLGWTDAKDANTTHWNDWTFYVHVKQTETGGITGSAFSIKQIGETTYVESNVGSNTFYQWGRKDPMLPAASSDRNKRYYSAAGFVLTTDNTHIVWVNSPSSTQHVIVGHSIQNPHKQYYQLVTTGGEQRKGTYLGGADPVLIGNLWDANLIPYNPNTSAGQNWVSPFDNRLTEKTVYDPCPPGFCVPYGYFFGGFIGSSSGWVSAGNLPAGSSLKTSKGWWFGSDERFFPFTGARGGNGVTGIFDVTNLGYYWTSTPDSRNDYEFRSSAKFFYLSEETLRARHDQDKAACYAIRAVREQ